MTRKQIIASAVTVLLLMTALAGITAPTLLQRAFGQLVAGSTTTGAVYDLLVDTDGHLQVEVTGSAGTDVTVVGPLGQTTMAASIPVAIASDQSYVPINIIGGTVIFRQGLISSVMNGTATTQIVGLEGVASNYLYVPSCVASNGSTTVSTDINLRDGASGNVLAIIPAPAGSVAGTGASGAAVTFNPPLKLSIGNGLFAANVTTGSATKISCPAFQSTASR